MPTLQEVTQNLDKYDGELTIYAVEPWTCDSPAVLAMEPEVESGPSKLAPEAEQIGAAYFIEVFGAAEFLADAELKKLPPEKRCERLIRYAIYDA